MTPLPVHLGLVLQEASVQEWLENGTVTTRTHQTLRVGLRRIIRDPRASVRTRLQAIRLLIDVEGLPTSTKNRPVSVAKNGSNSKKLKQLLAMAREQKPEVYGLPDAPAFPLRRSMFTLSGAARREHHVPRRFTRCSTGNIFEPNDAE